MKYTTIAAVVFGLAGVGAQAATIKNGSFENGIDPGSFSTLNVGDTDIDDWTLTGSGSIDYIGSYWNASDGSRSVDLNGFEGAATLSTTIADLILGKAYRIYFDLSGNTDGSPTVKSTQTSVGIQTEIFNSSSPTSIPGLTWTTYSIDFIASGTSETLSFVSSDASGSFGAALDNVRIEAVPVPAGGLLLIGGLGALVALRRRKSA